MTYIELLEIILSDDVFNKFKQYIISVINGEIYAKNEKGNFQEIAIFKDGVTL